MSNDPADLSPPIPLAYRRRPATLRRRALPVALLVLGLCLSIGCIPFPSSQQFMMNGKLRPSWAVGTGKGSAVRLGYATTQQAIDVLTPSIAGVQVEGFFESGPVTLTAGEVRDQNVFATDDGRHLALRYQRRTGFLFWPLCFQAQGVGKNEFLVFDVNEAGIVTDYHTTGDPARYGFQTALVRQDEVTILRPPTSKPAWAR